MGVPGGLRLREMEGFISLASMLHDWTNTPLSQGNCMASKTSSTAIGIQESPCKKWIKLVVVHPVTGIASWLTIYVIQEGDVFVNRLGVVIRDAKPGHLLRMTYLDGQDPYFCSSANITFMYRLRTIAVYDEETDEVKRISPVFEEAMVKVKTPSTDLKSAENISLINNVLI